MARTRNPRILSRVPEHLPPLPRIRLKEVFGITLVVVTHSLGSAFAVTDRIALWVLYLEEVDSQDGQGARVARELELRDRDGKAVWSQTVRGTARGRAASGGEVVLLVRRAFDRALDSGRQSLAAALKP